MPLPRLPEAPRRSGLGLRHLSALLGPRDRPEQGPLPHSALGTFQRKPGDRRAFCTRCGAHVFGVQERSEEIELFVGSFDETNLFTPTYELWTIRRERWLGDLPTLTRHFERDRIEGAEG